MTSTAPELDTATAVLASVRSDRSVAEAAEVRILQAAVQWAAMHSTDSIHEAATLAEGLYGDRPLTIAGPGAPLVAEFSIAELSAALGLPTEIGKAYLGEVVELRYRLGRLYARVEAGQLPVWRARRIARQTILLAPEAATWVDHHVAPVAHKIGPAAVDRLVTEAIARFMPEEAERRRREAADGRHFTVHTDQVASTDGTCEVAGVLDLADALDLDAAVRDEAALLKELGSTEPLDVRRAQAVGVIARRDLTLDLTSEDGEASPGQPDADATSKRSGDRRVVLNVHLTDTALTAGGIGRCANTRTPVTAQQIRDWCGTAGEVVVRPVLDIEGHTPVDSYEISSRMAEQVRLRDHHCAFPWCNRSAERCDLDHVTPWPTGRTCPQNLAPLCRRHHRLKTHGRWTITTIEAGTWLWTTPHQQHFLVDHTGTRPVTGEP